MKTVLKYICILLIFAASQQVIKAQLNDDHIIFKAMNDELNRNVSKLMLDKYQPPFFISYRLNDNNSFYIQASLGAIKYSYEGPNRYADMRLMVGDYSLNDENFVSGRQNQSNRNNLQIPLNNDYDAIRRSFWMMGDQVYKSAIETYEQKLTALKQQNKTDEEKLDDYTKISPINLMVKDIPFNYNISQWEEIAKSLSMIFKTYNEIYNSSVQISFSKTVDYVTTSEGSNIKMPITAANITIYASTQAEDGEPLSDQLYYCVQTPDQLPSVDKIKKDIQQMADNLTVLRKAPVIKDAYSGPVIFEGSAVLDLCIQKLFSYNGLIASREPVYAVGSSGQGSVNKLDNKVNQKICSKNISITALSKMKMFNNTPLIGNFEIDAEGVVPKDEMILVDKGILKTLLNDRVPTSKVKESNGYFRFGLNGVQKAPGVININYNDGESIKSLRKKALKEAENDGLEYIYIIRKLQGSGNRNLPVSKPYSIYKVSVKTGEEQLIRSAIISEFQMNAFKYITQGTKDQNVYNFLFNSSVPVSFIVPQALVFSDISIEKDKSTKPKLPVVSNPVIAKN